MGTAETSVDEPAILLLLFVIFLLLLLLLLLLDKLFKNLSQQLPAVRKHETDKKC